MSSPGTIDGNDKEETYTTLDGTLDAVQTTGQVRLETPQSQSRWFTKADAHIWLPLAMSSTIFLGGNFALRYARNTRLLRRRRVLVGAFSAVFPIRAYLGMRADKQQDDIGEGHPMYEAWGWTVAMFADPNISNSIQRLRHHDVPLELLEAYKKLEKRFLDCETRGECLFPRLLNRSRFMWSSLEQRLIFYGVLSNAMHVAEVPPEDTVLFAAHTCLLANRHLYAQRDLLSRCVLAAAFGFGFVVESPVALVLVGTAGVCSLAHQLAIATLDLHVISDVWMYHEPQAISRLLSISEIIEEPPEAT